MSIGISIHPPFPMTSTHEIEGAAKNKVASVKFKVTFIKHEILSGHIPSLSLRPLLSPSAPSSMLTGSGTCNPKEMLIWVVKLSKELSREHPSPTRTHSGPPQNRSRREWWLRRADNEDTMEHKLEIQFGKSLRNAFIAWFIRGCPKLTSTTKQQHQQHKQQQNYDRQAKLLLWPKFVTPCTSWGFGKESQGFIDGHLCMFGYIGIVNKHQLPIGPSRYYLFIMILMWIGKKGFCPSTFFETDKKR